MLPIIFGLSFQPCTVLGRSVEILRGLHRNISCSILFYLLLISFPSNTILFIFILLHIVSNAKRNVAQSGKFEDTTRYIVDQNYGIHYYKMCNFSATTLTVFCKQNYSKDMKLISKI